MKVRSKRSLFLAIVALAAIFCFIQTSTFKFLFLQERNVMLAGTWEDDPKNWSRAFDEAVPAPVKIIHSKYWKSNHFTEEHAYYFEVQATPEWRDAFLKRSQVQPIAATNAWSFRESFHSDLNPNWFAPDAAGNYEVWDHIGYHGSIWINKTNGHIFFYDIQV